MIPTAVDKAASISKTLKILAGASIYLTLLFLISEVIKLSGSTYALSMHEPRPPEANFLFSVQVAAIGLCLYTLNKIKEDLYAQQDGNSNSSLFLTLIVVSSVAWGFYVFDKSVTKYNNLYGNRCPIFQSSKNTTDLIHLLSEHRSVISNHQALKDTILELTQYRQRDGSSDFPCVTLREMESIKLELIKVLVDD